MVKLSDIKTQSALIDVKASGLMSGSFPVEVGFLVFEETKPGDFKERVETYVVKPDAGWDPNHWDVEAQAMHGLSFHDLRRFGHDTQSIAAHLLHHMRNRVVFTDAVEHDERWLDKLHQAAKRPRDYEILSLTRLQRLMGLDSKTGDEIFAKARARFGHSGRAGPGVRFLKEVLDQSIIVAGIS